MKSLRIIPVAGLLGAAALAFVGCQSDDHAHMNHGMGANGPKPYPLSKCIVTDDAFDHEKPVVFVYQGQEIKLCCKDCRKDFDKDPAKYLTKLSSLK